MTFVLGKHYTMVNYYEEIKNLFPLNQDEQRDFRTSLAVYLEQYIDICLKNGIDLKLLSEISYICNMIKDIARCLEKGLHVTAFKKLDNLFHGTKKHNALSKSMPVSTLEKDTPLYRIRLVDERKKKLSHNDMFHIPLNRKGIIRTQRYSTPGYPCLYVGESIYGCWEEMHRCNFDQCFVSRLEITQDLTLLDMRVPTEWMYKERLDAVLLRMPLIIACSIIVKNPDDVFKPEYSIPQLLTEWIINNNNNGSGKRKKGLIYGIRYTSSFASKEFEFPGTKSDNVVFFVLDPLSSKKHCPELSKLFKITSPTCNEYEKLKKGYDVDSGTYDNEANLEFNYDSSDFGQLEERLLDKNKFPAKPIDK